VQLPQAWRAEACLDDFCDKTSAHRREAKQQLEFLLAQELAGSAKPVWPPAQVISKRGEQNRKLIGLSLFRMCRKSGDFDISDASAITQRPSIQAHCSSSRTRMGELAKDMRSN
jgi:hypothetical protein